jgi:tetratricopeptide (TPR) repeat protein
MAQITFSHAWLELLNDPYSVLGLPLNADEKLILKQYRNLAKQLHPDRYGQADPKQQEFVGQLVARLLNPAHGKIKQARDRSEMLAVLRLQAQQLARSGDFRPTSEVALMLMQQPMAGAEMFYESQVAQLAEQQYESFHQFGNITHQLHELNLVYLIRKLGSVAQPQTVRDLAAKAPVAAAAPVVEPTAVVPVTPKITPEEADRTIQEGYARRHYERAEQYIAKGAYDRAAQEMKDALRLIADKSEYHALLSYAYLLQDLPGMAVVYCRQALKLNPTDVRAVKLAKKLNIPLPGAASAKPPVPPTKRGLLGGFFRGK